MKEDLLKIINNYGVNNQQKKLNEEVFELQEAITMYEQEQVLKDLLDIKIVDSDISKKQHIAEEIADVMVLLNQFKAYYNIPNETVLVFMRGKVNRQLERIKNEVKE